MFFKGKLSSRNNGGFTSFKMAINQNLNGLKGVTLNCIGDGNRYKMTINMKNN